MPPKKGQRQARGLARQDQILEAAFRLFAVKGVRGTTIAAVADEVGLSEAGVLHHFGSKEELLLAVLDRADSSFPETEAYIAEPGGGIESLRRWPARAKPLVDQPTLARLRIAIGSEAIVCEGPARRYTKSRTAAIRRALARCLQEGIRRGELRADIDVDQRAAEIVAFMEGIQIQWLLDPETIDIEAAHQAYMDSLLQQLT
jgi:AcrR family transcriptional regulator